jgi:proteic killer suppression protein
MCGSPWRKRRLKLHEMPTLVTARFADGERVSRFQAFARQAYKRLEILDLVKSREDLMALPNHCFEALSGDRSGQYSIRINQQWRMCVTWPTDEPAPYTIEITDFH